MKTFDIKRFRQDKKLTQIELSQILSCKQSFLSSIENGKQRIPPQMIQMLRTKYTDIDSYIIDSRQDITLKNVTPENIIFSGAEKFSRQILELMNEKKIAPYNLIDELNKVVARKDCEISELNRKIGQLEAELTTAKRGDARMDGNAICADAC